MKEFDISLLKPRIATLKANFFQNSSVGIPPTLFFEMEVPFHSFSLLGKEHKTNFTLNFIQFPIRSLDELYGKTFPFPINPEEGYIDGSMYFLNAHNPVDITNISFGYSENGLLPATLHYDLVLEFEKTGFANLYSQELDLQLQASTLSIDYEIMEDLDNNKEAVKEQLSKHFDISGLTEISNEDDMLFRFPDFNSID